MNKEQIEALRTAEIEACKNQANTMAAKLIALDEKHCAGHQQVYDLVKPKLTALDQKIETLIGQGNSETLEKVVKIIEGLDSDGDGTIDDLAELITAVQELDILANQAAEDSLQNAAKITTLETEINSRIEKVEIGIGETNNKLIETDKAVTANTESVKVVNEEIAFLIASKFEAMKQCVEVVRAACEELDVVLVTPCIINE